MHTRVAAVIFDMDGLMIDSEAIVKPCIQRAAAELACELDDDFYATLIGRGTADCDAALLARFGQSFPLEELKRRVRISIRARMTSGGIPIKRGLEGLLALLDEHRVPSAVATSTDAADAEFSLRTSGLWGRFGTIVTGDQVRKGKPEPDIYLEAASRLGADPAACVALEDSNAGVLAASKAGMITLMVPDAGLLASAEALAAAHRVLPSLEEVTTVMRTWLGVSAHDR
jgi:beta-phosphoglucomutase-like phosphatase (HAD superfamily)